MYLNGIKCYPELSIKNADGHIEQILILILTVRI